MKTTIKNIIYDNKFLSLGEENNKTYKIPIYQRHYDWNMENVVNLLNDIADAIELKKPHFTGSFLITDSEKPIVIDGQQRMITTLISLKAFYFLCEDEDIKSKIEQIIFTDVKHKTSEYLRLMVSKQDEIFFNNIMCIKNINQLSNHDQSKMYQNFKYAYDFFMKLKNQYTDKEIYELGFGNVQVCILVIEEEIDDDAQKIFRDLNSKGQALKNSDLIRNYLLMSQEELYDQYWVSLERMFYVNNEFNSELFEEFIYNYVLMKSPTKIIDNKVFNAYVSLCEKSDGVFNTDGKFDREKAVDDLSKYASLYRLFLNININEKEILDKYADTIKLLAELREMKQTTPYPFLMQVLMDEKNGVIDIQTLNKVINLIIIYYVRAIVCNLPSGSRRGYLLTMYKNIFGDVKENKNNYYNSIYKYIVELDSSNKMPAEEKFLKSLETFNLYGNRPVCRHLLKVIVNNRYPKEFKETMDVVNPTIEHLLPETPDTVWENELGGKEKLAEAMEYVHTIGNLSLANHNKNSELSNKSRKEKAEILEKYGEVLNVLNRKFIDLDEDFSLQFIKDRAKQLIEILKERYNLEEVNTNNIYFENYEIVEGTEELDQRFKGKNVAYIEIEGNSYKANDFYMVNAISQSYFAKHYHKKYMEVVANTPTLNTHPILITKPKQTYYEVKGCPGVYFKYEEGGSNFFSVSRVAKALGIPLNQIRIFIKKEKINSNNLVIEKVDDLGKLSNNELYRIKRVYPEIYVEGIYDEGSMIILKGSKLTKETLEYMNDFCLIMRKKLLEEGIVDSDYRFVTNCRFRTPGIAATITLGYTTHLSKQWGLKSNGKISLQDMLDKNK